MPPTLHFHPQDESAENLVVHYPKKGSTDLAQIYNSNTLVAPAYIAPNVVIRLYSLEGNTQRELTTMGDVWEDKPELWFVKEGSSIGLSVQGFDESVLRPDKDLFEQGVAAVLVLATLCDRPHCRAQTDAEE